MTAESRVAEFARGSGAGHFPRITRDQLVRGLRERLANPNSINQGVASLCGPASLFHCLLRDAPERYVQYVIDLYASGHAHVGSLEVTPGTDCRNARPVGIAPVDWVALASLRDSENTVLDYDEPSDQLGGITMPRTLASWFRAIGYQDVVNETNIWFTKGESDLNAASRLLLQTRRVCLFINANLVTNGTAGGGRFTTPNHWVVLANCAGIRNGRVTASVWTWAQTMPLGTLTVEQFCGNFFGYVAARFPTPRR